jgi:tetratricopeptide (TPR) repeat protein
VTLAATLVDARRYAEARREAEEALTVRDDEGVRTLLMAIAVITGDGPLEAEQTRWASSRDDVRESLFVRWGVATYRGRLREAEALVAQGEQAFGSVGLWPVVGRLRAGMALTFALVEDRARTRALVDRLEHDHPVEDTADELVVVAALLRDPALARRWLAATLKRRSTSLEDRRVASLLTALADAASDPAKALGALADLRQNAGESEVILIRGVLALRLGRHDEALRDFEWFRDHGRNDLGPNAAACRFLIARVLDRAGRQAEARKAYADFLEFWKTADRDLPIVIEASKAFTRLSS